MSLLLMRAALLSKLVSGDRTPVRMLILKTKYSLSEVLVFQTIMARALTLEMNTVKFTLTPSTREPTILRSGTRLMVRETKLQTSIQSLAVCLWVNQPRTALASPTVTPVVTEKTISS
jgi:hypothetical protein